MKQYYLAGILLLFIQQNLLGNQTESKLAMIENPLSQWVRTQSPPDKDSFEWRLWFYSANYSSTKWFVTKKNGHNFAQMTEPLLETTSNLAPAIKNNFQVKNILSYRELSERGYLVSIESKLKWKRGTWHLSKNGYTKEKVSNALISNFFQFNNQIFGMTSMTKHIGVGQSSIFSYIKNNDNQWSELKSLEFDEALIDIGFLSNDTAVLLFETSIALWKPENRIEYLVKNGEFSGLYPNSISVDHDKNTLYVGMRQYVMSLNIDTNKTYYLIPDQSYLNCLTEQEKKSISDLR